jgi:putative hydrolase of the HAD superfamily
LKRWQAILFDLDDTLYPERDYVLSGMKSVAAGLEREIGVPAAMIFAELRESFEAGVRGDTFNRWVAKQGLDAEAWVPRMVELYRTHEPIIQPYPGVRELLDRLRRQCPLGLISDGYLEVQRLKWKALQLQEYFQAVIFSDAYGRDAWKPSAQPYEEAVRFLKLPANEMAYVADNPLKDFRGARALGIETLRIRQPGALHGRLEPAAPADAPDREIVNLADLELLMREESAVPEESTAIEGKPL